MPQDAGVAIVGSIGKDLGFLEPTVFLCSNALLQCLCNGKHHRFLDINSYRGTFSVKTGALERLLNARGPTIGNDAGSERRITAHLVVMYVLQSLLELASLRQLWADLTLFDILQKSEFQLIAQFIIETH